LRCLVQSWPAALHAAEQGVAQDLVALAMDLARQVLGQSLAAQPQAILAVVHDLLQAEPALVGSPQLMVHPDDGEIVSALMEKELLSAGWRIRCDADIQRGGCRVLSTSGERDATLQTRWERVAASLARHCPVPAGTGHG
jgi:flagellar assembly protein FliH